MPGIANSDRIGLAELVGALSLGLDLGFGQPMERVLRQCWIALRLAEHLDLDEEHRSVVYCTALLTNVGCHTDAHEQAKWFGDDIELKADKYVYGPARRAVGGGRAAPLGIRSARAAAVPGGLNFALSGHKDLDGMVARHSALARSLAAEIGGQGRATPETPLTRCFAEDRGGSSRCRGYPQALGRGNPCGRVGGGT